MEWNRNNLEGYAKDNNMGMQEAALKLLNEAPRSPCCYSPDELKALERDAKRYWFLRNEDNWGEDSGANSWSALGESHATAFDDIVDSRMAGGE